MEKISKLVCSYSVISSFVRYGEREDREKMLKYMAMERVCLQLIGLWVDFFFSFFVLSYIFRGFTLELPGDLLKNADLQAPLTRSYELNGWGDRNRYFEKNCLGLSNILVQIHSTD